MTIYEVYKISKYKVSKQKQERDAEKDDNPFQDYDDDDD